MPSSSARRRLLLIGYPPDGGVARHIIDLVTALDADRWDVDLACLPGSDQWCELLDTPNVRLHGLHGSHGRPTARDLRDIPMLSRLARQADVVHTHSSKAGFLHRLPWNGRSRRRRTVFTPHGWSFWSADGAERWLYVHLERVAARSCHAIVTVSRSEREAGLSEGVGQVGQYSVIPNGIDLGPYSGPARPEPGRIVFVGRLHRPKRPDLAVLALAEVRRTIPNAHLEIVGEGPLRSEVESLVKARGLGDAVRLLGARGDIPALLSRAACFVLTTDYEGCPLAVMEAMAAGVPVVASAAGGVPELVVDGETGILVESRAPDSVARAVSALLADPARARVMGLAGRELAQRLYSRERMAHETAALYNELIAD